MESETVLIVTMILGAVGSAVKIAFDYLEKKSIREEKTKLEQEKIKAEAAVRASVVGIERFKKTMTASDSKLLSQTIKEAALEESADDFLNEQVNNITKRGGTRFFDPRKI